MIKCMVGLLAILGMMSPVLAALERPISVVFLNPGFSHERFWVDYTRYMHEAAEDLGIKFRVLHGERDTARLMNHARQVLGETERPDYLIFTNEQFSAPEILRLYADSGIKLFALHNTLNQEQLEIVGRSRERYADWIGSLVPNDEQAGYQMGRALVELAQGQPAQMLAFTGIKQTPSATLRLEGLQRALDEAPHVRLVQALYGEWKQQRAYEQASRLLHRYPEVSLVWSANDEMAFGVMQAAHEQGRSLHYTALNNSQRVLKARADGRIEVLASGHFLLGSCALAMLHDHAHGMDFAERGGKDQTAELLRLIDAQQAARLARRLRQPRLNLDFTRFSMVHNPGAQRYACSIDALLE
ncbi:ABC transporter substrate-binding protein [Pseudomonas sp. NCCP-436]|uniref:ABC transporter substrate-binding protein n=1 Tax=Pseudomonas sp. NCCP-436 TaxID=2842481 RepID=UPI001D7FFDA5|nr:ABC transporter substrate-binding protein [Pseudomonas sp. NCCP-436]GIZ11762.1 sugar ABC transporter substrate-binding protein [Pseudomonas sp. NCCP-436]